MPAALCTQHNVANGMRSCTTQLCMHAEPAAAQQLPLPLCIAELLPAPPLHNGNPAGQDAIAYIPHKLHRGACSWGVMFSTGLALKCVCWACSWGDMFNTGLALKSACPALHSGASPKAAPGAMPDAAGLGLGAEEARQSSQSRVSLPPLPTPNPETTASTAWPNSRPLSAAAHLLHIIPRCRRIHVVKEQAAHAAVLLHRAGQGTEMNHAPCWPPARLGSSGALAAPSRFAPRLAGGRELRDGHRPRILRHSGWVHTLRQGMKK